MGRRNFDPARRVSLPAANTRTADTLCRAVREIARCRGAESGAQLLGVHWATASGSKTGTAALAALAMQAERELSVSYDAALARIAAAFMAAEDRDALRDLCGAGQSLTVHRFSNLSRRTGRFTTPAAARARWMFGRPPHVCQTATVRPLSIFAAKKHPDGAVEVILRPGSEPRVTEAPAT